ncbi:hypothetical protein MRB53_038802 [Persea americana]|nr:hypothetical protein MRB53_038802 [Persea americana]
MSEQSAQRVKPEEEDVEEGGVPLALPAQVQLPGEVETSQAGPGGPNIDPAEHRFLASGENPSPRVIELRETVRRLREAYRRTKDELRAVEQRLGDIHAADRLARGQSNQKTTAVAPPALAASTVAITAAASGPQQMEVARGREAARGADQAGLTPAAILLRMTAAMEALVRERRSRSPRERVAPASTDNRSYRQRSPRRAPAQGNGQERVDQARGGQRRARRRRNRHGRGGQGGNGYEEDGYWEDGYEGDEGYGWGAAVQDEILTSHIVLVTIVAIIASSPSCVDLRAPLPRALSDIFETGRGHQLISQKQLRRQVQSTSYPLRYFCSIYETCRYIVEVRFNEDTSALAGCRRSGLCQDCSDVDMTSTATTYSLSSSSTSCSLLWCSSRRLSVAR